MSPTAGSLFTGIGGMDLGLERAGFEVRWQVEIDDYCRRVLAKHWPDVKRYEDVKELTGAELEPVDLFCGGFPCQPVSLAGRRLAQEDARWLWPHFARLVCVLRPRFVLVENVPGLFTAGFGDVLADLASLGYDTEWESIPAAAVGAPHLRWRVFVVAYPSGERHRGLQPVGISWSSREAGPCDDGSQRSARDAQRPPTDTFTTPGRPWGPAREPDWGSPPPAICGVDDGIPFRLERLRGLGNAVVPQVAEFVGRLLVDI